MPKEAIEKCTEIVTYSCKHNKHENLLTTERELVLALESYCNTKRYPNDTYKLDGGCDENCILAAVCAPATWPDGREVPEDLWASIRRAELARKFTTIKG